MGDESTSSTTSTPGSSQPRTPPLSEMKPQAPPSRGLPARPGLSRNYVYDDADDGSDGAPASSSSSSSSSSSGSPQDDEWDTTSDDDNGGPASEDCSMMLSVDGMMELPPNYHDKKNKNKIRMAAREHSMVLKARVFVLTVLAITAGTIALIVYILSHNDEINDYQFRFEQLANHTFDEMNANVRQTFVEMNTLSTYLTMGDAQPRPSPEPPASSTTTMPFMTVPDFLQVAHTARNLTGAAMILFAPIISEATRTTWQSYSVENQGWIREGYQPPTERQRLLLQLLEDDETKLLRYVQSTADPYHEQELRLALSGCHNSTDHGCQKHNFLQKSRRAEATFFRGVIPSEVNPLPPREERYANPQTYLYAPAWKMLPPPHELSMVNHDLLSYDLVRTAAQKVNETREAVIFGLGQEAEHLSAALLSGNVKGYPSMEATASTTAGVAFDHPTSLLLQPVRRTLVPNAPLGGFVLALIPWESYLIDTFGKISNMSLYATVQSSCAAVPTYTYVLRGGQNVEYLGRADDDQRQTVPYDDQVKQTAIFPTTLADTIADAEASSNNTDASSSRNMRQRKLQQSPENCDITVTLYPTYEFRSLEITTYPQFYALSILAIFGILGLVFLIYDFIVERRQYRVMALAERTGRVVANLFPTHFATKLLEEDDKSKSGRDNSAHGNESFTKHSTKKKKTKDINIQQQSAKDQLNAFVSSRKLAIEPDSDSEDESPIFLAKSKPIADLFPESTVLFADIAGFTSWSSVREPTQVFTLLETVYKAFDTLAKQYGVFKIETIGDCYVAVCGLPEPRDDHAVAMCRFANACMGRMTALVSRLEVILGPDTGDLTMRIGIHSGPVTAGVLRGERARFQLFGDTVNTAARMESTGERDNIQLSQETADLVIAAGKEHWVIKREGTVQAKGKGELQTYWLQQKSRGLAGGIGMSRRGVDFSSTMQSERLLDSSEYLSRRASMTNRSNRPGSRVNRPRTGGMPGSVRLLTRRSSTSDFVPDRAPSKRVLSSDPAKAKKLQRLVDWNCELLQQLLRQIIARRNVSKQNAAKLVSGLTGSVRDLGSLTKKQPPTVLSEVTEIINLPEFDAVAHHAAIEASSVSLSPEVVAQLRRYVSRMATMYQVRDNPFHNFEHASHVAMSVSKLLSRIVAPDVPSLPVKKVDHQDESNSSTSGLGDSFIKESDHIRLVDTNKKGGKATTMRALHDHTFGITSDALTQFACVFSALIHDVDHRGISNPLLCKEDEILAARYKSKSVAEQNSVDLAWSLFMEDEFQALRGAICASSAELKRFRQIIVNSVMATDIFDKELSALRKNRWDKAFHQEVRRRRGSIAVQDTYREDTNRKATIVLEHLIQASDVSHCMQHWHVYLKWNEALFHEMLKAYQTGRSDTDPSVGWYKGEIWFYDNCIIPLAKKLKECGVFGVSSDEYLNYAQANRKEWEKKGEAIVAKLKDKYSVNIEETGKDKDVHEDKDDD